MIEGTFYVSAKNFVTILLTSFLKTCKKRSLFQKLEPDWKTAFLPLTSDFFEFYAKNSGFQERFLELLLKKKIL